MDILISIYVFCIGACLGSFMNVLTYRMPRGLSIITPPSSCTSCGNRIKPYDNIPIISWILLRGRCRFCGEKISVMYPMAETVTGLLFLAVYIRFGLTLAGLNGAVLVFFALAAAFSDVFTALDSEHFECGIIPDSIVFTGIVLGGILAGFANMSWRFPVYGAAVGFLGLFIPSYLFQLIRKKEGMGGGDIKLVAMCGAMLGVQSIFFIIFASALVGAVVGIFLQLALKKRDMMMPFGPFISISAIIYLFYGAQINKLLFGI